MFNWVEMEYRTERRFQEMVDAESVLKALSSADASPGRVTRLSLFAHGARTVAEALHWVADRLDVPSGPRAERPHTRLDSAASL